MEFMKTYILTIDKDRNINELLTKGLKGILVHEIGSSIGSSPEQNESPFDKFSNAEINSLKALEYLSKINSFELKKRLKCAFYLKEKAIEIESKAPCNDLEKAKWLEYIKTEYASFITNLLHCGTQGDTGIFELSFLTLLTASENRVYHSTYHASDIIFGENGELLYLILMANPKYETASFDELVQYAGLNWAGNYKISSTKLFTAIMDNIYPKSRSVGYRNIGII